MRKIKKILGKIDGIEICSDLNEDDRIVQIEYKDLSRELKGEFQNLKKQMSKQSGTLFSFTSPMKKELIIDRENYLFIVNLKLSVINRRSVDDATFLNYLLQSLNKKEITDIFKNHEIRGYSKLNKDEMIDFLSENLSEEEIREYLMENEQPIISLSIAKALQIINKKNTKEKIKRIDIPKPNDVQITFEGFNWKTESFLYITKDNITDPERDCNCITGSKEGFCEHFWVGFIKSVKMGYLKLEEWNLTHVPTNFEKIIKDLNI